MSKIKLPNVRINFARLFKAEGFQGSSENAKYNAQFILDSENPAHMKAVKKIRAEIMTLGQEKWGKKWKGGDMNVLGYCLKSADEELQGEQFVTEINVEDDDGNTPDYLIGAYQLAASEKTRPTVVNAKKEPITEEDNIIYDGCYVTAIIGLWAQDNKFGKRINANLIGVQFKGNGEAFGSAAERASDDDFDDDDFEEDEDL